MTQQLSFLDVPARQPLPPRQVHSSTSTAAAVDIEPRAETLRRIVLDYIRKFGLRGATDEECQIEIPMAQNTQRPRRVELVRAGLVIDSGRTRYTASGRRAVVWIAK